MLPESAQGGGVDLYRAARFPDSWVLERRLLDFRCVDSSIFHASGSWWMMTSPQVVPGNAPITWLLRSDRITGPWRFQPGGIVASDVRVARGAGAVFEDAGRLIRPSQDCSVSYGYALHSQRDPFLDQRHRIGSEPSAVCTPAGCHSSKACTPTAGSASGRPSTAALRSELSARNGASSHDDAAGRVGHDSIRRRHGRELAPISVPSVAADL